MQKELSYVNIARLTLSQGKIQLSDRRKVIFEIQLTIIIDKILAPR